MGGAEPERGLAVVATQREAAAASDHAWPENGKAAGAPLLQLPSPGPSDALILIAKLAGEQCNIDCLYCFEKRKPAKTDRRIDAEVIHDLLRRVEPRPVRIILHGGEPLLVGKLRMASILDAIASHSNVTSLSVMTNGTLIDEGWVELFDRHAHPQVEWGISYDGGGMLNDHRVSYRNTSTSGATLRGIDVLHRHGKSFGVISVINNLHVGRADDFITSVATMPGLRSLKLVPCLDYGVDHRSAPTPSGRHQAELWNPTAPGWSIDPMDFAHFVVAATSLWVDRGLWRRFELEPTMSICRNLLGGSSDFTDYSLRKDAYVMTVYPDGRITGHDRAEVRDRVGFPAAQAGSGEYDQALQDVLHREVTRQEAAWRPLLDRCGRCRYWDGCHGSELFTRLAVRRANLEDRFCASRAHMIDAMQPYLGSPVVNGSAR